MGLGRTCRRINERMWELAAELAPGAIRLADVAATLDGDDARAIFGTDALLARLEAFTAGDRRRSSTACTSTSTADPALRRAARAGGLGGRAVLHRAERGPDAAGHDVVPDARARRGSRGGGSASTWYHEAVPGHHLQDATSLLAVDRLNRFQRTVAWTSGYGEGWALYAERLMEELGAFADPADELGYLEGQGLRAARIVVDLGLHLGYAAPERPRRARRARRLLVAALDAGDGRRAPRGARDH